METTTIHINSTISTEGARYATGDIRNMYTNSRLDELEYMRIQLQDIPEEVSNKYKLKNIVNEN